MTITITHTPEDGTVVDGDPRPHQAALKDAGFRYSRNVGWYIRGSRDRRPQQWRIDKAAAALREVGFEVVVDVEDGLRPIEEREAARAERIDGRQEALDDKAERKSAVAGELINRARDMASIIPFGQPILVGHHSERRDRNYRGRIDRTFERGFEAHNEAADAERKAEASRHSETQRESGPTTKRRIDRLETELRDIERKLTPCPTSGRAMKAEADGRKITCPRCYRDVTIVDRVTPEHGCATGAWREQLLHRQVEIHDELIYWREHLASIGFAMLTKADFKPGDPILVRGSLCTVVRANPKTVSVTGPHHSWPIKYGYEDVSKPEGSA